MNENERIHKIIEELRSLPEPDYNKYFDMNKQNNIHENLMKVSRKYEAKQRSGSFMKRASTAVLGLAAFMLFAIVLMTINSQRSDEQIGYTFEDFFHEKMAEMPEQENNYAYTLIHTEMNAVQDGDAIAVYKEDRNEDGEVFFIAYFEKQGKRWVWKQSRGSKIDSPVNWTSMNQAPFIYFGLIRDHSIVEVYAGDTQAKIITVADGNRFWYAISPKQDVEVMLVKDDGSQEILDQFDPESLEN
ncbi:hypothetical protein [Ornithinibacillus xuwenensis]|uniref:DUF4367 domain-containing protein n=1 Tax=Ornithinibacillus xuwenensis TaxID=3144668 RepID=A0ABU9XIT3_9BACI